MFANFIYSVALCLASPLIAYRMIRHGRYRRGIGQKLLGLSTERAKQLRDHDDSLRAHGDDSEALWSDSVADCTLLNAGFNRVREPRGYRT